MPSLSGSDLPEYPATRLTLAASQPAPSLSR